MNGDEFSRLVRGLLAHGRETEWIELKHNNTDPQVMGQNLSAVSNGAALHDKPTGYLLWGVADSSLEIVGTSFQPRLTIKGNEELENWLLRLLQPRVDVRIHKGTIDSKQVVLMEVGAAALQPTRFSGQELSESAPIRNPWQNSPKKNGDSGGDSTRPPSRTESLLSTSHLTKSWRGLTIQSTSP